MPVLGRIIKRILKVLTRKGALIENAPESLYLADSEHDPALARLHAAVSTYRIALGPRAGQKVLTWKDPALALSSHKAKDPPPGCVSDQGFSLHAVSWKENQAGKPWSFMHRHAWMVPKFP